MIDVGIIYKVTSPSGKVYIGQTIRSLKRRKYIHERNASKGSSTRISNAIRKYGNKLKWEILHENVAIEHLDELEQKEIENHDSFKNGYNGTLGGGDAGFRGKKHSEETIKILSVQKSGIKNPMFGRKKESNPFYGKKHSKESKEKMSKSIKAKGKSCGNNNSMSYQSIMGRYKCTFEEAKQIRRKILCQ